MQLHEDWRFRGLINQVTDEAIFARLDAGTVTAYVGFDPTASSLHLGSLLPLCNLRRLQVAGNCPIALAGGGTGLVGDPSFKDAERPLLSLEQLDENVSGIREQMSKFLDFTPSAGKAQAKLLNNADWLTTIPLTDFLRDVGKHFTVNQMIAKESVKSRLDRDDVGLSFTEFTYMLLQAYDFLRLNLDHGCTLQMGGSDQWGNITMGTELVRKQTGETAYGLTSPLLLRADGTKFGKSEAGENIWLDPARTSPFKMYQFLLNSDDVIVPQLLRFFTFLDHDAIVSLDEATSTRPEERQAQRALAVAVVTMVHGEEAATKAQRASEALFSTSIAELDEATLLDVLEDAPTLKWPRESFVHGVDPVDLLATSELAKSKAEARRFLDQGGVYLNNERLNADSRIELAHVLHGRYLLLRRGSRQQCLVVVE
jgi:tyrosyl-tRNA synthetase